MKYQIMSNAIFLCKVGQAKFRAPELLFRPDLIGEECEGLHEVLTYAIDKSDMDLRRTLFSNIVLSGGPRSSGGSVTGCSARSRSLPPRMLKLGYVSHNPGGGAESTPPPPSDLNREAMKNYFDTYVESIINMTSWYNFNT